MGLSAIIIAAAMGAKVVAVDISEQKLDLARKLGASATINALQETCPVSAPQGYDEGGAHVSMDALGSTATLANSINCLRPRGVHLQVGLMLGKDANPEIPMGKIIEQEIAVMGGRTAFGNMLRYLKRHPEVRIILVEKTDRL